MGVPSLLSRVPRAPRLNQEEPQQTIQFVSFRIGSEEFGVDILMLREIIRLPTITPIPNTSEHIVGMINLRGKIIPVIDLRKRLRIRGEGPGAKDKKSRILIVELLTHVTGFIVDSVSEVIKVPVAEIEPAPHLVVTGIDAEYIKGVIKLPSRLIVLLDFSRILKPQEHKDLQMLGGGAAEHGSIAGETIGLDISFNLSHRDGE